MKKTSMILTFGLLFYTTVINGDDSPSAYTYSAEAEGWLKLHQMPNNWHEARLICHYEGATLASPINTNMLSAMMTLLKKQQIPQCSVFTGVHATYSKGVYFSLEGVPLTEIPINWAPGEPDNFEDSEDCLILLENGTMADAKCSDTFPYICHRKEPKEVILNECGTTDNEYVLSKTTGSCYKFHSEAQTWHRAFMVCAAEGGYLAVINSNAEATILKALFAQHPPNSIRKIYRKDYAHVGFVAWDAPEFGVWMTIHGQTFKEAGYAGWEQGRPDNTSVYGEFCGCINRNGMLDDMHCINEVFVFICEKNPTTKQSLIL